MSQQLERPRYEYIFTAVKTSSLTYYCSVEMS